jgi:immunoglobulin-binding protein 1
MEHSLQLADALLSFTTRESLFSNNELLEDLPTETIPFLLVPYYKACILVKNTDQTHRKSTLELAESLIDQFLTYLDNYRLTPENFKEKRKSIARPTRDEKILAYKTKKELENNIKLMEEQRPEDCRELYVKELELAAIQSLEHLEFIRLEYQMLEMKQLPKPEPLPYKPPTIVKIDESNVHLMPHIISGTQDLVQIRETMKSQVFTNRNAPSMTIEEYGDWAYKEMKEREARTKKVEEEKKDDNSEDEDQVETKRKKDSEWDDWKDEHEKGAGNRNGR